MKNLQLPVSVRPVVPEQRAGLPSVLPSWFRSETGLLDYEAQDATRQILPVNTNGKTGLRYELLPTDGSPNWGGSGRRVEVWPEKDTSADYEGSFCMGWVFPDTSVLQGLGWAWVFQYHVGPAFNDGTFEGGLGTGLSVLGGDVGVYFRYRGTSEVARLKAGEPLFAQVDYRLARTGGYWRWKIGVLEPPAADQPYTKTFDGDTLFGAQMYPKTGLYAGQVPQPVSFRQTCFVRRASAAEARAAAGWEATVPPPTADSLPLTYTVSPDGAVLTLAWTPVPGAGYELWIDGARQKSFSRDPGKSSWRVGRLSGTHVYEVRALDYGVNGKVVA